MIAGLIDESKPEKTGTGEEEVKIFDWVYSLFPEESHNQEQYGHGEGHPAV